tara:strand:+ start:276 stop:689 length:414 start_codon:yes stop_codon:yes gene_type:complete
MNSVPITDKQLLSMKSEIFELVVNVAQMFKRNHDLDDLVNAATKIDYEWYSTTNPELSCEMDSNIEDDDLDFLIEQSKEEFSEDDDPGFYIPSDYDGDIYIASKDYVEQLHNTIQVLKHSEMRKDARIRILEKKLNK